MSDSTYSPDEMNDRVVKCGRCDRNYNSDDRVPRVLPCQHKYCTDCLEDVWRVGSKLSCPSCGQEWDVKNSVAETFPVELSAMKSVVFVEMKDTRGRRLCNDCSDRSQATHYCLTCQLYLCDDGVSSHRRFYKTRSHDVVTLDEIMNDQDPEKRGESDVGSQQSETCMIHHGSVLDLYCEKPSCMKPVCPSCAMIQHKERDGHEIRDLKEVVVEEQEAVSRSIERLERQRSQDHADRKELETELVFLNMERKRLEANIEKHFKDFIRLATEQKEDLKESLRDVFEEDRQKMKASVKSFTLMNLAGQDYITYCHSMMADPKPTRFLEQGFEMKHQLEVLATAPRPEIPEKREVFVDLTSLNDLMNKMARIGEVIYVDEMTLQWKCVVEITDCFQGENQVVVKVTMQYTGDSKATPIAPYVKAMVEDSSGHVTRTTLNQADMDEDEVRAIEDSTTSQTNLNGNLGVTTPNDRRGTYDIDRYQDAGSHSGRSQGSRKQSFTDQKKSHSNRKESSTYRKHYGDKRSDVQSNSKTSFNDDVVLKSIDSDRTGSQGERSRSSAVNGKGNNSNDPEVVSQMYFRPRVYGPHKVNFRIGGYPVSGDDLTFISRKLDEGLDKSIHFLEWSNEHEVDVKTLKLPYIAMSEDRLNRSQCTITDGGKLIKFPSTSTSTDSGRDSDAFTSYCGTVGTRCFSGHGYYYWHVTCNVRVLARVGSYGKMILEAAVAHGDVLDTSYCVWETPRAWSLVVSICSTHKAICLKVVSNSKVLYDSPVMDCDVDSAIDLDIGVLLDMDRGRCLFLDGKSGAVMWEFTGLDTSKSLWPVFGVYNRFHFSVELGVTSGEKLELTSDELKVIEGLM